MRSCDTLSTKTFLSPSLRPTQMGKPVRPLTVVLDLDETLVRAREGGCIYVRPFLNDFLNICEEQCCEIVVWTAGAASYVNPILHAIADACQRKAWFHHIISRDQSWCKETKGDEVKVNFNDFTLLDRSLDRVLVIENSPDSVSRQPSHAIFVEDYLESNNADQTLRVIASTIRRTALTMRRKHLKIRQYSMPFQYSFEESEQLSNKTSIKPQLTATRPLPEVLSREAEITTAQFKDVCCCAHGTSEALAGVRQAKKPKHEEKARSTENGIWCWVLRYSLSSFHLEMRYYGCRHPLPA